MGIYDICMCVSLYFIVYVNICAWRNTWKGACKVISMYYLGKRVVICGKKEVKKVVKWKGKEKSTIYISVKLYIYMCMCKLK